MIWPADGDWSTASLTLKAIDGVFAMPESILIKPTNHGIFVRIALSSYGAQASLRKCKYSPSSFTAVSLDVDSDRSGDSMRLLRICDKFQNLICRRVFEKSSVIPFYLLKWTHPKGWNTSLYVILSTLWRRPYCSLYPIRLYNIDTLCVYLKLHTL